ncbi:MAG: SPOR domain-containing protein [Bacteroidota bacterium]
MLRNDLRVLHTINGALPIYSIESSQSGEFYVQYGISNKAIDVYDRNYDWSHSIHSEVYLSDFYYTEYEGKYQGNPLETAITPDGNYIWVCSPAISGDGFHNPGSPGCVSGGNYDPGFVFKISTKTYLIESAIEVGSYPTNLCLSQDGKYLMVANWCSEDVSVIDTEIEEEKFRLNLGKFPRGLAIHSNGLKGYVSLMGDHRIMEVDLIRGKSKFFIFPGRTPRELVLGPSDKYLYACYPKEGNIRKINLETLRVVDKLETGRDPYSMQLSEDGNFLYVIHRKGQTLCKIRTDELSVIQCVSLDGRPEGIALDHTTSQIWVSFFEGDIKIFQDDQDTPVQTYSDNPFTSARDGEDSLEEEEYTLDEEEMAIAEESIPLIEEQVETYSYEGTPDEPVEEEVSQNYSIYHVIVGSFRSMETAEQKRKEFSRKGAIYAKIIPTGTGFYRLSYKGYASMEEAEAALEVVQQSFKTDAWIFEE